MCAYLSVTGSYTCQGCEWHNNSAGIKTSAMWNWSDPSWPLWVKYKPCNVSQTHNYVTQAAGPRPCLSLEQQETSSKCQYIQVFSWTCYTHISASMHRCTQLIRTLKPRHGPSLHLHRKSEIYIGKPQAMWKSYKIEQGPLRLTALWFWLVTHIEELWEWPFTKWPRGGVTLGHDLVLSMWPGRMAHSEAVRLFPVWWHVYEGSQRHPTFSLPAS